jgi:hypothetical protein
MDELTYPSNPESGKAAPPRLTVPNFPSTVLSARLQNKGNKHEKKPGRCQSSRPDSSQEN